MTKEQYLHIADALLFVRNSHSAAELPGKGKDICNLMAHCVASELVIIDKDNSPPQFDRFGFLQAAGWKP
jgi:hypothetical protein